MPATTALADLGDAGGAAVGRDDQAPVLRDGPRDGSSRQPVTLVEAAGDVRLRVDAQASQCPASGWPGRSGRPRRSRRRPAPALRCPSPAGRAHGMAPHRVSSIGSCSSVSGGSTRLRSSSAVAMPRRASTRSSRSPTPSSAASDTDALVRHCRGRQDPAMARIQFSRHGPGVHGGGVWDRPLSPALTSRLRLGCAQPGSVGPRRQPARRLRRSSQRCQSTSSGEALKIDE